MQLQITSLELTNATQFTLKALNLDEKSDYEEKFLGTIPEILDDPFPESLYSSAEEFLDKEQLVLTTYPPSLACTKLKPSINIKKLTSLIINPSVTALSIEECSEGSTKSFSGLALPTFLQNRAQSMEVSPSLEKSPQETKSGDLNVKKYKSSAEISH